MTAREVMHADVVSVSPDASVLEAVKIMLERGISAVLVMDGGNLVGILTEGDLLRRSEIHTERRRTGFRDFFVSPGKHADEYIRASGRKVHEIMTREVHTIAETADVRDAVDIMEKYNVKRVPVVSGRSVVGIITRADLLRALVAAAEKNPAQPLSDGEIRRALIAHLETQKWYVPDLVGITIENGTVTLSGAVMDQRQLEAFEVAAENIPGVKKVDNQLIWIDPISGSGFNAAGRLIEPGQVWDTPTRSSQ